MELARAIDKVVIVAALEGSLRYQPTQTPLIRMAVLSSLWSTVPALSCSMSVVKQEITMYKYMLNFC